MYIFGAGNNGKIMASFLQGYDVEVMAFIDNDEKKWGCVFAGIGCISVCEALKIAREDIILNSVYDYRDTEKQLLQAGFRYVCSVKDFLGKMNYYIPGRIEQKDCRSVRPFNFYESPFPDTVRIHAKEEKLFRLDNAISGIDFQLDKQIEYLEKFQRIPLLPWKDETSEGLRYYYNNGWFSKGCAHALYFMMNCLQPKRIIEVGSGFSTAVMMDTNQSCMGSRIEITCIEPNPHRLERLRKGTDELCVYKEELQDISVDFFETLQKDDILFIDSSHVSKFDSDVNYIFFKILPVLKKGVFIHFHDIFYPFTYPSEWVYAGRAYNEMYLLRAFLMHNLQYTIELFPDMLVKKGYEESERLFDSTDNYSIWIKKTSE